MERELIDYYPSYLQRFEEIRRLVETEQPEMEVLWDALKDLMDDQFILDATINGLRRLEKIYGITPKGNASAEERRYALISRICERIPFTIRNLHIQLGTICGEGQFSVELEHDEYVVHVKVHLPAKSRLLDVKETLDRVLPANLIVDLDIRRNQHGDMAHFSHSDLAQYTYLELREEVLKYAE